MNQLLKKSFISFCDLDLVQKIILTIIFALFLNLFVENFIFASSLDTLILRSVDDLAFQYVLREKHENITHLQIDTLFKMYHYGYGWLFWIVHVVLTFPFYLISLLGSDALLISGARNISLISMIGSCIFLFKSIRIYTNDKYIPYFAVLLFISYPFFAFSALSFRTVGQSTFFCTLTFYLMIRNNVLSKNDLKHIALSFAACIGTKISTLVFAPLLCIFLMDRFKFRINKDNFKNALFFLKYFIPATIFFCNPSLFIAPFKWSLFTSYFDIMTFYFKQVHNSTVAERNILASFQNTYFLNFLHKYILATLASFFLVKTLHDLKTKKQNKFDFLYIFTFLTFSSVYLVCNIQMGDLYTAIYFFSFSFLLVFSIVILEKLEKRPRIIALTALVAINSTLFIDKIKHEHLFYYTKYNTEETQTFLKAHKDLQELIDSKQPHNFLISSGAPLIYSSFRKNINSTMIFDNISTFEEWTGYDEFNYILLKRNDIMFSSDESFDKNYSNASDSLKSTWIDSRKSIKKLMNEGQYRNSKYQIVYDKYDLILFRRTSSCDE